MAIDAVDRQLLDLLRNRIELVMQVADIKREHNAPVYDAERERQVIERLRKGAESPLTADMVQRVFEVIIEESRRLESVKHAQ
ncbi:MAG TPA: chorismate mutase [Polyangiaceae bacterium]|jgi:chorismate mutase|nr:chorismate mutase [Polyangiaceae bacterium]